MENRRFFASFWHLLKPMLGALVLCFVVSNAFAKSCDDDGGEYLDLTTNQCVSCAAGTGFGNTYVGFVCPGEPYYNIQACAENEIPYFQYGTQCLNSTSASTIYGAVIKSSLAAGKYITPDGTVADCDDTAFANLFGTTGVSNRYFYFYGLDGKPYNYGNKSDVGCLGKTNILYIPSSTGLHTQYYAKGLTKCPAEHYAYANLNYKICEPTGTAAWQTDNYTCSAGQYIPQGYRSCQSCTSIPASSPYGCAQSFSTGKSSINEGSGASSDIFASSANRCATGYKWKNNQRKQCIKCAEGYSYNNSYVCSHETPDSDTGTIGDIGNIGNIGNIPVGTLPVTSGTTTFLCDNGSSSSLSWSNSSLTFPTISSKCSTPSTDKRTLWLCAKGVSGNNGEQYYIWKTQKQGTTAASNDLSGLAGAICAPAMPMKVYWPTQNDTPAEFYAVYIAQSGALAIVNMVDANTYWGWGQVINYVPTNWYSVSTLADYVNSFSGYFDVTRIRDTPRGESHTITETNATAFANALKNQYQYLNNWGISLRVGPKMSLTCPDNTVKSVVYTKTNINQTDINNLLAQCTTTYSGNDKELLCHDGNSNNYAQVSGDNSLCFWPFIPSSKSAKSTSGGFYCETYVCKTNIVHCDAGTYLPANSSTCSACSTGYYCTGGDFIESSEPQGKYACADTSANGGTDGVYPTTWSGTNYSAKTACLAKITFHGNGGQATRDDTGVSGTDWTVGAKYVNSSSYSNSCNLGSARLCKSSDTNYRITDGVTLGSNNKLQTQWQRSGHDFAGWWYKNANVTANECTSISGTYDATAETCTTNGSCPSDWTKIENECVPDTKLTQVTATTDLTGSRSLYAKWTIKCAAGTYLPANSTTCQPCPAVSSGQGYYCLGGDFETSTTDQGLSNCPPGYPWSAQGNSSITTCYITMSFYPSKDAVFRTATYNTDNSYNNLTNVYKQSNYWFALVSNTDGTKHMAATLLAGGNTAPTKTGYTFDGWMWQLQNVNPSECTAAGMTSSCADVSTCNNASKRGCNLGSLTSCPSDWSFYGGLCIPDSKLTAVTASTNIISGSQRNFYAKWTQIQYTVQYDCGLGSGTAPANGTANYNQTFTPAANTCTKDGYTFTGWKVSGTEDIKTQNVGFTWEYQASKTFTAQWQPIQYTISFNANGGTGTKSSVTCTYGVDCDIANKSNEFRKTGLTWVGWKSSNNNSYGSTISEPYMADLVENNGVYTMTLTAQWANNGGSCNPGYYYSAASQGCVECVSSTEDGYYCPGGIHTGGNTDQLRNTCPTGWDHSFVELNNGSNNVTRPSKPGHCFKIETTTCDVASPFSDPHGTVTYTSAGTNTVNCRNFYGSNTCQLIDSRECNVSLTCDTGYTKTINNVLYDYYATAGNTYTYDDTSINQTWTATFDYGVVTGESRLSLTEPAGSGTIYVRQYPTPVIEKSPYDTVPQAALCWCKTNTFTPTDGSIQNAESMWFPYAYLTYATQSTTTCPKVCGANVISSSGNGFRQGLFGTPPYCKVNTYAITYYYLYDSQMPIDPVTGTTLTNPTSYTIETETFTLYNPIREGYEFAGWCTGSANCASPQQTVTITQGTTGNKVYYAKWTATTYSIEYNTEGGVCSGGTTPENHNCSPTQYLITSANITLPSPTQSEHVFDGWCVYGPSDTDNGANCTSTNYVAAGQVAIPNGSTGNKTVYAKWNPAVYDVILDDQSGSGGSGHAYEKYGTGWYSNSTATTAFSPANTVVAPTRSGYTFRGYYSSQVEDVEDFDDSGTQVITKSGLLPDNETYDDSNTNANNEVTLYAAWARNCNPGAHASCTLNVTDAGVVTYTTSCSAGYEISNDGQYNPQCTPIDYSITYNATGGWCTGGNLITNNCSPTSYNVESAAITLPTPTRTGYIFAGWYDNSALIGTADTTISAGSTGDKEYWAKWTPNVLDLNWYAVIGDATPYTTNVCTYDSDITLPSTNPSRTGYTFTGWAVD